MRRPETGLLSGVDLAFGDRMKNSTFALIIALIATPSFAATLNPQPEPPGKSQVMSTNNNANKSVQDNQSGLPTGHKLPPGPCVSNTVMASQTARQNAHCNKRLNPQPEPPG